MGRLCQGLAQTGAWSCFDEFNRIGVEVLSVVAGQMATVQRAIASPCGVFLFEGTEMPIHSGCAFLVTMNPFYAGRSELPDNLKALFRPCAMTVPSHSMIAEILLYSYGFLQSELCAARLVRCLSLAAELLSPQSHYDFGLRCVKAVVVAAAEIRRREPSVPEVRVAYRALVDCNVPKMAATDIMAFSGVLNDMFPDDAKSTGLGRSVGLTGRGRSSLQIVQKASLHESLQAHHQHRPLEEALAKACAAHALQPTPTFVLKCVQLYETLRMRHGLMIVGGANAGKSSMRAMLNCALKELAATATEAVGSARDEPSALAGASQAVAPAEVALPLSLDALLADEEESDEGSGGEDDEEGEEGEEGEGQSTNQRLEQYGADAAEQVMFPMAVSLQELYGSFHPTTREWTDGVLALAFRAAVKAEMRPSTVAALGRSHRDAQDAPVDGGVTPPDQPEEAGVDARTGGESEAHQWRADPAEREAHASVRNLRRQWLVLDGPVDAMWAESMNTVLDDNKKLCFASGEIIRMTPRMSILFETDSLSAASPATVSRVGIVYVEPEALGWRPMVTAWLNTLPSALGAQQNTIRRLFDIVVPPCIELLSQCKLVAPVSTSVLVCSHCKLLLALAAEASAKSAAKSAAKSVHGAHEPLDARTLGALFLQSLIWSLGGCIDASSRPTFERGLRQACDPSRRPPPNRAGAAPSLKRQPTANAFPGVVAQALVLPSEGTVWDFTYDRAGAQWMPWLSLASPSPPAALPTGSVRALFVPTTESESLRSLIRVLHGADVPAMLCGPTAAGKSAVMTQYVSALEPARFSTLRIVLTPSATASEMRALIEARLERRQRGVLSPPDGMRLIVLVDDMHAATAEPSGAQPPLELLRQCLGQGACFDSKGGLRQLLGLSFMAAMAPAGSGRASITPRYLRLYHVVAVPQLEKEALHSIFSAMMAAQLGPFRDQLRGMLASLVDASLRVYTRIQSEMRPTPARAHYTFSIRDLQRLLGGIALASPQQVRKPFQLIRLWVHECFRVFSDRLVCEEDRSILTGLVRVAVDSTLKVAYSKVVPDERRLLYANFMPRGDQESSERIYDMVSDVEALQRVIEGFQADQARAFEAAALRTSKRSEGRTALPPLKLVMFASAIEHLLRIARVLAQPGGSALLIGAGGCGRRSLARLGAFLAQLELHTTSVSKEYGLSEWREDLHRVVTRAGRDGVPLVFLVSDTQLSDAALLGDVQQLMDLAEVPGLLTTDEMETVLAELRSAAAASADRDVDSSMRQWFVERCALNLHFVFAFSPLGAALRQHIRVCPALVARTTIDWYDEWPEDALQAVAQSELQGLAGMDSNVWRGVVSACVRAHAVAAGTVRRYLKDLGRVVHVTPTHYLDMLALFRRLLVRKRAEVRTQKERFDTGLRRLLKSAEAVVVMQAELEELKPKLLVKSVQSDEMLLTVTADRQNADQTKERVEAEEVAVTAVVTEATRLKESCEADLESALPALEAALNALKELSKNDIAEVKALKSPPAGVRLTMETVCLLKGVRPEKVKAPTGKWTSDFWEPSKRLMSDTNFLQSLLDFDRDAISEEVAAQVGPYLSNPDFEPERVAKASVAACGLCKWVRAMMLYYEAMKDVAPRRQRLDHAERESKLANEKLAKTKAALRAVMAKLEALETAYNDVIREKETLQTRITDCADRLARATRLIGGLSGERTRWGQRSKELSEEHACLVGDLLTCAATCTYLGPFTQTYRADATTEWLQTFRSLGHRCSPDFSLVKVLGEDIRVGEWKVHGLPSDDFSVHSAVIMSHAARAPLFMDPQSTATRWIKRQEKHSGLRVFRLTDADYIRVLEGAVSSGAPVLCESMGEALDPVLLPLISAHRADPSEGPRTVRLGEATVTLHCDFRFYMATSTPNPHYLPEVASRVTLLNFTITCTLGRPRPPPHAAASNGPPLTARLARSLSPPPPPAPPTHTSRGLPPFLRVGHGALAGISWHQPPTDCDSRSPASTHCSRSLCAPDARVPR